MGGTTISLTLNVTSQTAPAWYSQMPVNAWAYIPSLQNMQTAGMVHPDSRGDSKNRIFYGGPMVYGPIKANGTTYRAGQYWTAIGGGHNESTDNCLTAIGPFEEDNGPSWFLVTPPSPEPRNTWGDPAGGAWPDGTAKIIEADGQPTAFHPFNQTIYNEVDNKLLLTHIPDVVTLAGATAYHPEFASPWEYDFSKDQFFGEQGWTYSKYVRADTPNYDAQNDISYDGAVPQLLLLNMGGSPTFISSPLLWKLSLQPGASWTTQVILNTSYIGTQWVCDALTDQYPTWETSSLTGTIRGQFAEMFYLQGESTIVLWSKTFIRKPIVISTVPDVNGRGAVYQQLPTFIGDALPDPSLRHVKFMQSGIDLDREARVFYMYFTGYEPYPAAPASDIYKVTLPPARQLLSAPWVVQRIPAQSHPSAVVPAPSHHSGQWYRPAGISQPDNSLLYGLSKTLRFVKSPTKGLFYLPNYNARPVFWRLA